MANVFQFDDELYNEQESYGSDYDEAVFGDLLGGAANIVGGIVDGTLRNTYNTGKAVATGVGRILGVEPQPAKAPAINHSTPLTGKIRTQSGKDVSFQLPAHIQQNAAALSDAVRKLNTELKKVADITNNNGQALAKLTKNVSEGEGKQNEALRILGKTVSTLKKQLAQTRSQVQTQMMMQFLLKDDSLTLREKTVAGLPDGTTAYDIVDDDDNDMLLMMMMNGGGNLFGGGNDAGGDDDNNSAMQAYVMSEMLK